MKSRKCFQCGFVGFGSSTCKGCGASLEHEDQFARQWTPDETQVKKGLAVLGLVLGIVGFFTLGILFVGAIVGIVVSVKAMKKASESPWEYGGRSLAIAGLVLNVTALTSAVPFAIVAAIAVPNLLAARMAANEGSALYTMRILYNAQMSYFDDTQQYGTLQDLIDAQLVEPSLANGVKNGYGFKVELFKPTGQGSFQTPARFELTAVPLKYQSSGKRSFFLDDTGVFRAADSRGAPATRDDMALEAPNRSGPGFRSEAVRY
jgi:type IV pilus assembly protein PilA